MPEKKALLCWPDWMPKPLHDGYKFSVVDRRVKTDMEVGSIYRVQFDTDECTCDCTLALDKLQSAWFESFEQSLLRQGTLWFEIPLQSGGEVSFHTVRFKTRPTLSEPGPVFSTYNFTLDVDKRPEKSSVQIAQKKKREDDIFQWPSWMPKPQRSGYKLSTADIRQKSDMEVGSIYHVLFDTDECTCDCTLVLDNVQSAWFENFERTVLNQGAHWFELPLKSGGEISMHKVRFKTRPTITNAGKNFSTYQFTLDIYKRPDMLCPQIVAYLVCVMPEDLLNTVSSLSCLMLGIMPNLTVPDFWLYGCDKRRTAYELGM